MKARNCLIEDSLEFRRILWREEDLPDEPVLFFQDNVFIPVQRVQLHPEHAFLHMQAQRFQNGRHNFDLFDLVERNLYVSEPGVKLNPVLKDFVFLPETLHGTVRCV